MKWNFLIYLYIYIVCTYNCLTKTLIDNNIKCYKKNGHNINVTEKDRERERGGERERERERKEERNLISHTCTYAYIFALIFNEVC